MRRIYITLECLQVVISNPRLADSRLAASCKSMKMQSSQRAPKLLDSGKQAGRQTSRQAGRLAGRHTGRLAGRQAGRQETKSLRQSEQCKKARLGKQGGHKTSYHILVCDSQRKKAYGNGQMQIWRKRLRNHRSVITNVERKCKALES